MYTITESNGGLDLQRDGIRVCHFTDCDREAADMIANDLNKLHAAEAAGAEMKNALVYIACAGVHGEGDEPMTVRELRDAAHKAIAINNGKPGAPWLLTRKEADKLREDLATLESSLADIVAKLNSAGFHGGGSPTTLEAQVDEALARLAYVRNMGLHIGMMTTSDKPEPYLMHTWEEDSDHGRMFREWSASIGWEEKVAALRSAIEWKDAALREIEVNFGPAFDLIFAAYSKPADSFDDDKAWVAFLCSKVHQAFSGMQKVKAALSPASEGSYPEIPDSSTPMSPKSVSGTCEQAKQYRDLIPGEDVYRSGDQIGYNESGATVWIDVLPDVYGAVYRLSLGRRPLPEIPKGWTLAEDGKRIEREGDGVWIVPEGAEILLFTEGKDQFCPSNRIGIASAEGGEYRLPWPPTEGKEGK